MDFGSLNDLLKIFFYLSVSGINLSLTLQSLSISVNNFFLNRSSVSFFTDALPLCLTNRINTY